MGEPAKRNEVVNLILSWIWALAPAWTLGFGTAAIQLHAAVRKHSVWQGLTVLIYAAGLAFVLLDDPDIGTDTLFNIGMSINLGLGLVHAVGIRSWVFETGRFAPTSGRRKTLRQRQADALAAHDERAKARQAARALAVESPETAVQLQVGRPDVPRRSFPDGGLVDVNSVDADTLTKHLGFTTEQAETVVRVRAEIDGFASAADLGVLADLGPRVTDAAAELMIFLPYRER